MLEESQIDSVNKHYLDKVMDLAEEMDVEATEDIFDARGMKLIARGARISRNLQEKLILHKLRKPLEATISVEGGVNPDTITKEAQRLAKTIEPVACILRATESTGTSPLKIIGSMELGNAMKMMLTIIEKGGQEALQHSVMVSLVSICLASKLGLSEEDQKTAALAGLLHDIGELYIEPEYLHSKRRLLPHEWRHVVVHPRIGQMLIAELEDYPPAVAQAVAEHHERFDGSGYPRQAAGPKISIIGQAVSVAEMISGVFMKRDRPLQRAELAMKIIPGEHAHKLVSAISGAFRGAHRRETDDADAVSNDSGESIRTLSEKIAALLRVIGTLLDQPTLQSKKAKDMVSLAFTRIKIIERAFISTGLDVCLNEGPSFFDAKNSEIWFEVGVAAREIQWRFRDVARDLALHAATLEPHEVALIQPLINMLDQDA